MVKISSNFALLVFGAVWAIGCSSAPDDQPELGYVSGTVTLDNEPAAGLSVVFGPESGRSSAAITDEEGKYTLIYRRGTNGAKVGPHKVSITTPLDDESDPDAEANFVERVPARYNTETTLTADVKEGNNVFDFDLETSE